MHSDNHAIKTTETKTNIVNNVSFDNFAADIYQDIRPSVSVRTVIISVVSVYRWELWTFQCFLSIHPSFIASWILNTIYCHSHSHKKMSHALMQMKDIYLFISERRLQRLNLEHYQLWAGLESNEAQGMISATTILMHRAIKVSSFLPSMLDCYSASATNSNNWIHRIRRLVTVSVTVTHCHQMCCYELLLSSITSISITLGGILSVSMQILPALSMLGW